ncbi:MAG: hypothetical protein WC992_02315 [Acholeplasmataceae bacterium]|jgi:hypothetical protein
MTELNLAQLLVDSYPGGFELVNEGDTKDFETLRRVTNERESGSGLGDTLFVFLVRELADVTMGEPEPLEACIRALESASREVDAVLAGFTTAMAKQLAEEGKL